MGSPPSPLIWKKSITFAFPKYVPVLASRFQVQPQIVGGLRDGTSGTLTAPDLDLNMEWQLEEEVMSHVEILTLDGAASGQYRLKVVHF